MGIVNVSFEINVHRRAVAGCNATLTDIEYRYPSVLAVGSAFPLPNARVVIAGTDLYVRFENAKVHDEGGISVLIAPLESPIRVAKGEEWLWCADERAVAFRGWTI